MSLLAAQAGVVLIVLAVGIGLTLLLWLAVESGTEAERSTESDWASAERAARRDDPDDPER